MSVPVVSRGCDLEGYCTRQSRKLVVKVRIVQATIQSMSRQADPGEQNKNIIRAGPSAANTSIAAHADSGQGEDDLYRPRNK